MTQKSQERVTISKYSNTTSGWSESFTGILNAKIGLEEMKIRSLEKLI